MAKTLVSTNPSRDYVALGSVKASSIHDVRAAVDAARSAQASWQSLGIVGRGVLLSKVSAKFREQMEDIAALIAQEMGMPIREARDDVTFAMDYLDSYIEQARSMLLPRITFKDEHQVHTIHQIPLGVVACIVPWNFPMGNFVWQCGQNLIAGNTIVFKASEEVPLVGKRIEEIINSVLPLGVFNEVYGNSRVGQMLISQNIDGVCFTGSSSAGVAISKSVADRLLPTNMELGGSAPGIVFADADIESTINGIYSGRFFNNGQVCDGLKRLILHESVFDEVVAGLQSTISKKRVGDALGESTDLGPLASEGQLHLLESQVQDALSKGAQVVCGGRRPTGLRGAYYEPTIITGVTQSMHIWQEEVFGPVLPVVSFKTSDEAVRLANDTPFGLGGYIYTSDNAEFERIALALDTCMISQNNLSYVRPQNFFGGCKMSGHGREHAELGFGEVTRTKLIVKNT